jgi:SAM-dependent methyltransferase
MIRPSQTNLMAYRNNKNLVLDSIPGSHSLPKVRKFFVRFCSRFGRQYLPVVTARIIEYPILFQYLRPGRLRILDFGCVEDMLPIHLASLGYDVTGVDFRPYPFEHANFRFVQTDILHWNPPFAEYDTVVSISTIEHVGLSAYGDPADREGDKVAVEKLWQCLKPGGEIIITVPAGKQHVGRTMRIYDEQALRRLVPSIETLRFFYKPGRYEMWQETSAKTIEHLRYDDYFASAPAQGVAIVVARKN